MLSKSQIFKFGKYGIGLGIFLLYFYNCVSTYKSQLIGKSVEGMKNLLELDDGITAEAKQFAKVKLCLDNRD